MGLIFDFTDGDFCMNTGKDTAMGMDGHLMHKMGDNMAMDMNTGELHMMSGSSNQKSSFNLLDDDDKDSLF